MAEFKVLIVDPEQAFLSKTASSLTQFGMRTICACEGESVLTLVEEQMPEVILMSVDLPDESGIQICKKLNEISYDGAIVMMSPDKDEEVYIESYRAGSIDCVTKSFNVQLLAHKIKALTRRIQKNHLQIEPNFVIYRSKTQLKNEGLEIVLPKMEFELLQLLMSVSRKVFSREEISEKIWGTAETDNRNIDMHIHKLRSKIGEERILTIKGVGYQFQAEELKACC